jgi:hypothetical protein
MEGSIPARTLGYFARCLWGEHGGPVDPLRQVRGEDACVVLGSMLFWLCTGRRVLLGEVGVKSGISICLASHGPF